MQMLGTNSKRNVAQMVKQLTTSFHWKDYGIEF